MKYILVTEEEEELICSANTVNSIMLVGNYPNGRGIIYDDLIKDEFSRFQKVINMTNKEIYDYDKDYEPTNVTIKIV
jgi:D-alanine-D-alanine ligase-like ATP-grasp enzyme